MRNDQLSRQWLLLQRLEGSRGATLQELVDSLPEDFPKHPRTIRRDLLALEVAGFPLLNKRRDGQTFWRLMDGDEYPLSFDIEAYVRDALMVMRGPPIMPDIGAVG